MTPIKSWIVLVAFLSSSTKISCQLNATESAIEFSSSAVANNDDDDDGYLQIEDDIITSENATATKINVSTPEELHLTVREGNAASNVLRTGNGNGNGNGTTVVDEDYVNTGHGRGRGRGVFTYPYYKGGRTRRGHETTTAGTRQYCVGGCKSLPSDFGKVCAVFLKEERQDSPVVQMGYRTFASYCQMVADNCAHPGRVGGECEEKNILLPKVKKGVFLKLSIRYTIMGRHNPRPDRYR